MRWFQKSHARKFINLLPYEKWKNSFNFLDEWQIGNNLPKPSFLEKRQKLGTLAVGEID